MIVAAEERVYYQGSVNLLDIIRNAQDMMMIHTKCGWEIRIMRLLRRERSNYCNLMRYNRPV